VPVVPLELLLVVPLELLLVVRVLPVLSAPRPLVAVSPDDSCLSLDCVMGSVE
jgi:hypothetical protein